MRSGIGSESVKWSGGCEYGSCCVLCFLVCEKSFSFGKEQCSNLSVFLEN